MTWSRNAVGLPFLRLMLADALCHFPSLTVDVDYHLQNQRPIAKQHEPDGSNQGHKQRRLAMEYTQSAAIDPALTTDPVSVRELRIWSAPQLIMIATNLSDELTILPHAMFHYFSDADLRLKDSSYREDQDNITTAFIQRLRT